MALAEDYFREVYAALEIAISHYQFLRVFHQTGMSSTRTRRNSPIKVYKAFTEV